MTTKAAPRALTAILSVGLSASVSFGLAAHLWGLGRWPGAAGVLLLAGAPLLAALIDRALARGLVMRLRALRPDARLQWLLGVTLLAVLLLRAVPLTAPRHAAFELIATGERSAKAQGSEVWVLEARDGAGQPIALDRLERSGDWELRDGKVLVSFRRQPASLRYSGPVADGLELVVVSHPHSGVVRFSAGSALRTEDLYSATPGRRVLRASALPQRGAAFARLLFHAAHVVVLSALLLAVGLWLLGRRGAGRPQALAAYERWIYGVPPLLVWTCWLILLFPGLMSSDSTDQWLQAQRGQLGDFHPVAHTFLILLLQKLWYSPAIVASVQILVLSALVAWGCAGLRRAGTPRWAAWTSSGMMALAPINGAMAITLWKDVPFSIAVLVLALLMVHVSEGRRWTHSQQILLLVAGVFALLMRHNGAPVVLGAYLGLLLLRREAWRRWSVALLVTFVGSMAIRTLLLRAYDVPRIQQSVALIGMLGGHVAGGTTLTDEEQAILSDIHPLDDQWRYNCASNVPTIWGGRFRFEGLERHQDRLPALLARLTARNPEPVLAHVACASSVLWKISQGGRDFINGPAVGAHADGTYSTIYPAEGAPHFQPPSPQLARRVLDGLSATLERDLVWLMWRPALPFYLLVLACIAACLRRRSPRPLAVLLPLLAHTAVLVPLIPSPDIRYQYPAFLLAMMLVPSWFAGRLAEEAVLPLPAPHRETDEAA